MSDWAQSAESPSAEIALGPDLSEVTRMNRWFDALTACWGLAAPLAGDIKLCLNEAVTNVLCHGFGGAGAPEQDSCRIEVVLDCTPDQVTARIRDTGGPFDPRSVAEPDKPADIASAEIGGLGIKLIRDTATAMDYAREDGWNVLTLRFDTTGA